MNEITKDKLNMVANDDLLIKSLREFFDEVMEERRPFITSTDSNLLLGEQFRGYEEARQIIEKAFIELASYKNLPKGIKTFNKER